MPSSRTNYDAIVVGARCAGAPTAMLLARAGARVLLVDRARFPSDTISGHAIKQPGVAYLKRWGLLDAVLATGCPPIHQLTIAVGDRVLPAPEAGPDSLPVIGPRRTHLDLTLVQAAAAAGVDVHERTAVTEVVRDGHQVFGIQAQSHTGRALRALAPIVIGADGKQSFVARQVGAEYDHYQLPVSFAYFSYWSGASLDGVAMYLAPGRAAGMLPTHDGQVMAFVQCRWTERNAFRADVMGSYLATLRSFPAVADALAGATHEGPLRGMLDLPAFFRQSYGPGWALAGDAAHHKDPIIARGITDAFRDADLLAQAVGTGLGGETDLLPALARYQQVRDASSRQVNALNHRLAELPDDLGELERRLVELLVAEASADARSAANSAPA
jgi:2-polyprenyl-6-methoxyphenol hydroxylase-like FAD-dependent oxidoreductase